MVLLRAFVYFMLAGSSSAVYDIRGHLVCQGQEKITADDARRDTWVQLQYMERGATGSDWKIINGGLKQVSIGDNKIMGVNTHGNLYFRTGVNAPHPEGTAWEIIDHDFKYVAVGDGKIIGIRTNNHIAFRTGVTSSEPYGTGWKSIGYDVKQISIGDGKIMAVKTNNDILFRVGIRASLPEGSSWKHLNGKLKYTAIGDGRIMGVNSDGGIYVRMGVDENNPEGTSWQWLSGVLQQLSIGDGKIMGVNSARDLYFIEGLDLSRADAVRWRLADSKLKYISVGDGKYVGVDENDKIYFRIGYEDEPQTYCSAFHVGGHRYGDSDVIRVSDAKGLECINLCINMKKYVPSIEAVTLYHRQRGCYCVKNKHYDTVADMSTCTLKYSEEHLTVKRTTNDERVSRNGMQMHSVNNDDNYIHLEGAAGRTDSALLLMVKVTNYECSRTTPFARDMASGKHWTEDREGTHAAKYVNLGRVIIVDKITVNYRGNRQDWRLMIIQTRENDNGLWVTCNTFTYRFSTRGKEVRCSKTTIAAFVRVLHNVTASLNDAQVQVYQGQPNVALRRTAKANFAQTSDAHSEDKATDGIYDTFFSSSNNPVNFLVVDLKEMITIDRILLYLDREAYHFGGYSFMEVLTNRWNLEKWTLCNEVGMRFDTSSGSDAIQSAEVKCTKKTRARAVKIVNGHAMLRLNEVEVFEDAMWFYPPLDCFDTLTAKFGCKDLTFDLSTGHVSKQKWNGRKTHGEAMAEAAEAAEESGPVYYKITNEMFAGPLYAGLDSIGHAASKTISERQRHGRVLSSIIQDSEYSTIYNNGDILKWKIAKSPAAGKSSRGNDYYTIISKDTNGYLYATSFDISKWYPSTDHYGKVNKQFYSTITEKDLWEIVKGDDAHYTIINKALGKPFFAHMTGNHFTRVADSAAEYIPNGKEKWDIVRA